MSDPDLTLNSIFSIEAKDLPPIMAAIIESTDIQAVIKSQLLEGAAQLDLNTLLGAVAEKVLDLLSMPLPDIMLGAWKKYGMLADCLDQEKYAPGESVLVALAEHSLTSEHHPSIEILASDKEIAKLEFAITLQLHLESVVLTVQDQHVREIRLGDVTGEGSFECGQFEIARREFSAEVFPGLIALDPGIALVAIPSPEELAQYQQRKAETDPGR